MRIALLTHDFPGAGASGIASYTLHCAQALARFGAEPHIFTFRPIPSPQQSQAAAPDGVHFHALPGLAEGVSSGSIDSDAGAVLGANGWPAQLFAQAELLSQAVRDMHKSHPFDLIETPEVYFPGLPLMLRPIPGVPVVCMLHAGTAISRQFNDAAPSTEDRLIMALENAAMCLADGLCAPTQAVVKATREFLPEVAPVAVFPSPPPERALLTSASSENTGHYVMFCGRVERLKGCCELALAANIFLHACPDAEIRLYGPDRPLAAAPTGKRFPTDGSKRWTAGGSTKQWMIDHLDTDIAKRVRFMGATSPAEMAIAYKDCRFVVAPSRFENFGTAAVEALVGGRTVVYAAGTGMAEIVADAGLPANADDPEALARNMIQLWKDASLRRELEGRGAGRLRTELSPQRAVEQRISFYEKCIAAKRPRGIAPVARGISALPPADLVSILRFISGLSGSLAGISPGPFASPGVRAARAVEAFRKSGRDVSAIWLYGGGQHTRRLLVERQAIQNAGGKIYGIIDDAAQAGETLLGLPVLSRTVAESRLREHSITIDLLLLSSDSMEEKLWLNAESMRQQKVPVARLYM